MSDEDDGYSWPVHRSLTEPSLLAGVPRMLAILIWITTSALVFNLNQYWFLAIGVALHVAAAYLTRKDPDFFPVLFRALKGQSRLEP
jgi:type IV secretory pathway TrbD component